MYHLRKKDQHLDNTDIMILAHPLADPISKFFFTYDSKLIGNHAIAEYEQYLRDENKRDTPLLISDAFH